MAVDEEKPRGIKVKGKMEIVVGDRIIVREGPGLAVKRLKKASNKANNLRWMTYVSEAGAESS